MPPAETIAVEVAYAGPEGQWLLEMRVARGATAIDAIRASGIESRFPHMRVAERQIGIFGKLASADMVLQEGDRVEIYRPLSADPKDSRRERAQRERALRKKT